MILQLCQFNFKAMGSPCEIRLYAENAEIAAQVIAKAVAEINRLEQKYSRYKRDNFLFRVNSAAKLGGSCEIDDEFVSLLNFADTCYEQSEGLFDITSGVLREVWNFDKHEKPAPKLLQETLNRVGWKNVSWTANGISFSKAGMELDFGGIVKEYAADCAATVCADAGITHGIVNLGGDIKAIGPHPDGKPWAVKVRHPRIAGESLASIELTNGALASSGDYERFIEIDGERYCHILSPKTGWPVKGLAAVSVTGPQCIVAGSACTIAMLRESEGKSWLSELGLPHLWMDSDGVTNINLG